MTLMVVRLDHHACTSHDLCPCNGLVCRVQAICCCVWRGFWSAAVCCCACRCSCFRSNDLCGCFCGQGYVNVADRTPCPCSCALSSYSKQTSCSVVRSTSLWAHCCLAQLCCFTFDVDQLKLLLCSVSDTMHCAAVGAVRSAGNLEQS